MLATNFLITACEPALVLFVKGFTDTPGVQVQSLTRNLKKPPWTVSMPVIAKVESGRGGLGPTNEIDEQSIIVPCKSL
jgi:hypothetical protein